MTDVAAPESNAPAYSVSELAFALKRTLETSYAHVRLRGELSKVTHHGNGHVYLTIKDDKAAIDGVVWKGSVRGLGVRPEQGLEVIVTGKITTFPAGSRYQIVIESMEAAGVGALLAQLERLKAKLHGEGLFEASRKRPLPSMPSVVGVITSPTGAVIRDILHRIRDRWPCHVLVWPVVVQGDQAALQVANAIRGFNAIAPGGATPRPDILIVARGGGSVEDLWAFNDETLARTVAASDIPLISAVGHETDTTLIDFVSDRRAPTPTAAAEIATPVLGELRALVSDYDRRLNRSGARLIEDRRTRLVSAARGLPRPADLLALAQQRFDIAAGRLDAALGRNTAVHAQALLRVTARLSPEALERQRQVKANRLGELGLRLQACGGRVSDRGGERLANLGQRLNASGTRAIDRAEAHARLPLLWTRLRSAGQRRLTRDEDRLANLEKLRQSLNPRRPLDLGFALVRKADHSIVRSAANLGPGDWVSLQFGDGERNAVVDDSAPPVVAPAAIAAVAPPKPARPKPTTPKPDQGDLF